MLGARRFGPTASIVQPGKRNFSGRDWPVILAQTTGERPEFGSQTRYGSLTYRNCDSFCSPVNRVGLPGLDGGRCRDRTCDPSRVKGVLYR